MTTNIIGGGRYRTSDLEGKKLLIIGGAFQHCKVVEAAKRLGVITYVTDYLPVEKSPAKQISDHYYMYNITEVEEIVEACKRDGIEGAIRRWSKNTKVAWSFYSIAGKTGRAGGNVGEIPT